MDRTINAYVWLLILKKPSPKAKLETERVQNLAQYVKENENKYTTLKTAIGLFFSFSSHLIFFYSGSALLSPF